MGKIISVENVSKAYQLGQINTGTLYSDIQRWWALKRGKEDPFLKIGETNDRSRTGNSNVVWSLRDIGFDVQQGDSVGIIGKNGAGKSTLLKILSRITEPTTGTIKAKGKMASLLEVGTGFHPELSGRDNIFLNGAILGMRKTEIKKKFDEIVDFSGVERYIDTPVKRYSSGMYMRLAFAVAAHLESDILIVDEVLAVGDSEFQKKCIGKMSQISKGEGKTILFVSHNMTAVKNLCNTGIVLEHGKLIYNGTKEGAIKLYHQNRGDMSSFNAGDGKVMGNENIRIEAFVVKPILGDTLTTESGVCYEVTFFNSKAEVNLDITFDLRTIDDVHVFHTGTVFTHEKDSKTGYYKISGRIEPNVLNSGTYKFGLIFGENKRWVLYQVNEVVEFEIFDQTDLVTSNVIPGILRPAKNYTVDYSETI